MPLTKIALAAPFKNVSSVQLVIMQIILEFAYFAHIITRTAFSVHQGITVQGVCLKSIQKVDSAMNAQICTLIVWSAIKAIALSVKVNNIF